MRIANTQDQTSSSSTTLMLVIVLTAFCWPLYGQSSVLAGEGRPNIIFVMVDDLGYGDLGSFGQQNIKTPHLDQLATEGMRLTQFYAGSTVCAPSRCVLMTGLHTGHSYIRGNGKDNLRPKDVTIAEVLQQAGYKTALCGKWGLGHEDSTGLPTRQGFDHFFGYLDQHHAHNYFPTFLVRQEDRIPLKNVVPNEGKWGQGVASQKRDYSHDLVMKDALSFIDANHTAPFFLYLALTIPHANNEAGKAGLEIPSVGDYENKPWKTTAKQYAAMVSHMDADMGRMMQRLKDLGIDDDTIVFFTSDNGPHREGGNDPEFHNSNGPLRGIKRSLHEGGIRVPTIVRAPGRIKPGSTSDVIGGFWDVMPTLADLANATQHVPSRIDGLSIVPTLMGQPTAQTHHDHVYWAFYERGGGRAIRQGNWKAIQQPIHSAVRLYNLKNDIGEEQDLSSMHPEKTTTLTALMDGEYEASPRWNFPQKKK